MTKSFKQFKKESLRNAGVKAEYTALHAEHTLVRTIIKQRLKRGWSQSDLARVIGSLQPVISRLERGTSNPSLQTLERIAKAFDLKLTVSMR